MGAIYSVLFALIAIFLYILVRFRNVAFSVGSTIALAFDALTVIGFYSLLWGLVPFSLEIDQTFIGAILTVVGYSINDKVVVFDRIRENLKLHPKATVSSSSMHLSMRHWLVPSIHLHLHCSCCSVSSSSVVTASAASHSQ